MQFDEVLIIVVSVGVVIFIVWFLVQTKFNTRVIRLKEPPMFIAKPTLSKTDEWIISYLEALITSRRMTFASCDYSDIRSDDALFNHCVGRSKEADATIDPHTYMSKRPLDKKVVALYQSATASVSPYKQNMLDLAKDGQSYFYYRSVSDVFHFVFRYDYYDAPCGPNIAENDWYAKRLLEYFISEMRMIWNASLQNEDLMNDMEENYEKGCISFNPHTYRSQTPLTHQILAFYETLVRNGAMDRRVADVLVTDHETYDFYDTGSDEYR